MKLALLADIHGNHYALNAVLNAVKQQDIDTILIAGDFVGYYFWPVEVFKLLEHWNIVAVRGNHDRMLDKARNNQDFLRKISKKYGSGLNIALDQLDKKTIDWLITLPDSIEYETENGKILLCHGSPFDKDEYVYIDSVGESLGKYASLDLKWVVQGHTHYPMIRKFGDVSVINPGSVGQPRNRQLGAQWALLDTKSGKVDFFCEDYDPIEVIMEVKMRNPEIAYLSEILTR